MLVSVKFRGEEHDVEVTDRRDYNNPEWMFFGLTQEERDALHVTPDEDDDVTRQVSETLYDRAASWCPEDDS